MKFGVEVGNILVNKIKSLKNVKKRYKTNVFRFFIIKQEKKCGTSFKNFLRIQEGLPKYSAYMGQCPSLSRTLQTLFERDPLRNKVRIEF